MKQFVLPLAFLAISVIAVAQEQPPTPVAEFGLNYTATGWHPSGSVPSFVEQGGSGTLQYNFNRMLGVVGDFGVSHLGTVSGSNGTVDIGNTTFSYLFGPRISFRMRGVTPYVQGLVGNTRFSHGFDTDAAVPRLPNPQNVLTTAIGGGVNLPINDHIQLRLAQVDWYATRLTSPSADSQYFRNNLRVSTGLIFTVGAK